jgi:hypothetical protein
MITAAVLDKILGFLAPLFIDIVVGDSAAARDAAQSMLDSYGARNDRELRFAALSIAFSFGALDALSRAADRDLPMNQVLRLRGNANALNRAAQQNETRLEKAQRQSVEETMPVPLRLTPALPDRRLPELEVPELDGPEFDRPELDLLHSDLPASSATQDLVDFVRATWKAEKAAAGVAQPAEPMSRQQRRLAERQAEKQRQRELAQARLAQRAAQRDAVQAGDMAAVA